MDGIERCGGGSVRSVGLIWYWEVWMVLRDLCGWY